MLKHGLADSAVMVQAVIFSSRLAPSSPGVAAADGWAEQADQDKDQRPRTHLTHGFNPEYTNIHAVGAAVLGCCWFQFTPPGLWTGETQSQCILQA